MQLINAPSKLVLPFASAGAKNSIPVASQIGIVAGAASLTDGFPPLTRTPLAGGGVPPSGLDMNGILYELSAILRWTNAGGGYPFDGTFAADSNVGGYPKGARVMRSDGLGYWFNTADNNTTDPEGAGAVAAGWVPDYTSGTAAITMTSSNVTLTALQWGHEIIVITGTLTADLNLIFPAIVKPWIVVNNTTGAYSITAKTAAGTGVTVAQSAATVIYGDGTNIGATAAGLTQAAADARYLQLTGGTLNGMLNLHTGANIASAATLNLSTATGNTVHVTGTTTTTGVTMTAGQWVQVIVDAAWPLTYHATNLKLNTGGANYTCAAGDSVFFFYDGTTVYAQIVKADGTPIAGSTGIVGAFRNLTASASGASASVSVAADEIIVEDSSNAYKTLRAVSLTINTATSGANGLDTGTLAGSTWYALFVIAKADGTTAGLISTSATAPTMPTGYTFKARVGWIRTDGSGNKYPLGFTQKGRRVQYLTAAGSNVTALPSMASGSAGSFPSTWASVATGNFIPSTAARIAIVLGVTNNCAMAVGPNAQRYATPGGGSSAAVSAGQSSGMVTVTDEFIVESSNIYWISNGGTIFCNGWEDNL